MSHIKFIAFIFTLLLGGCYDSGFESPTPLDTPAKNLTLEELHHEIHGSSVAVENNWVIEGRVTTSDKDGNFYRSLCVEDEGFAVEVLIDRPHLDTYYPEGSLLTISLKGLYLGRVRGVMQVGAKPIAGSGYPTSHLPSEAVEQAHLFCDHKAEIIPVPPCLKQINELTVNDCGTLICIDSLTPIVEAEEDAPTWSGRRLWLSPQRDTIATYTRPYASFADKPLPTTSVMLTGIVYQESARKYSLKLRYENDCIIF